MLVTLDPQLQPLIAQHLDRRSFYRLSSSHRTLRHVLADPQSYIFNTYYRPRYLAQLIDDLKHINKPNASINGTSRAFPLHLTSHTARKTYLTFVRCIDLRYCCEELVYAPQITELLELTRNVTELTLTGAWTYYLTERSEYDDKLTLPDLRRVMMQLPLRCVTIKGPVWERAVDVLTRMHKLREFDCYPMNLTKEPFYTFPSLTSATLTERAFTTINRHVKTFFPALRTLSLDMRNFPVEVVARLQKLKLTSLCLEVYNNCPNTNLKMLLSSPSTLLQSLTTLELLAKSSEVDIFECVMTCPNLTSLHVRFGDNAISNPNIVRNMMLLTQANPRLRQLNVGWLQCTLEDEDNFPYELAETARFYGALSCAFTYLTTKSHMLFDTKLSMLSLPFFTSLGQLELNSVHIVDTEEVSSCLSLLHTIKLAHVSCSTTLISWLKRIAPNARHLHLRDSECETDSLCTQFPDLLSLELQSTSFASTDTDWLDKLARLPLRCIALGEVAPIDGNVNDVIVPIGQWMQRLLLATSCPVSFAHLRYLLFIPNLYTEMSKVRDIVPLLPDICAHRPHLQINLQDTDRRVWLLDYEQVMKFCD